FAATRKMKDPKWRGPDGAKLLLEIKSQTDNALVIKFSCNEWGAFAPGKPALDYAAVKQLKGSPDWQTVSVSLPELTASDPKVTAPLENWQTVAEFSISPSGEIVRDGQKVKENGKAWDGPREIRNLRWEGGTYPAQIIAAAALTPAEHEKNFNAAIKKSLDQEKQDAKSK
ncbi:MAG: hypothetical protein NTY53_01345, partial [Kiritimatiellaeota bacterium]|nr:hypothetical protein [Kiritimatiellota bacterium]